MTHAGLTPEMLDRALTAARRQYAALRDALEQRLAASFADTPDVADRLLSSVDEFGRKHTGQLLAERPRDWGQWSGHADWRAASADIQRDLDAMATLHERIDELTAQRAAAEKDAPAGPHRVHIQGRPYDFDAERGELRDIESGSRFVVELERQEPPREISLLDRLAERAPAELAPERPVRERTRER